MLNESSYRHKCSDFSSAVSPQHAGPGFLESQNLDEMKRIFTKKFPDKLPALESFIANSLLSIEIVDTPEIPVEQERLMRDMMDRPILRSAVVSDVDIILTGDKDFLESGIDHPRMMTLSYLYFFWFELYPHVRAFLLHLHKEHDVNSAERFGLADSFQLTCS